MIRTLNPELDSLTLAALSEKYKLNEQREPNHLSTMVYCLTKAFFDQKSPIEPTDVELLLFATGYGLQEVLTHSSTTAPVYEKDGIVYRPDGCIPATVSGAEKLIEVKSTRSGVKRYQEGDLPETWIRYMQGGCYIRNVNQYDLSVIYLSERPHAVIISETITFTNQELKFNWSQIMERKAVLDKSLASNKPPTPFGWAAQWMCANCRYKLQCDAVKIIMDKELWNG